MQKILIDTSIIIDFLRTKDKKRSLFFRLASKYALNISVLTHTELYAGKSVWENNQAQKELETIFSNINIITFDKEISLSAGKIRAKYNIDLIDAIIAATSLQHNLSLATLNIKDFNKVKGIKIFY